MSEKLVILIECEGEASLNVKNWSDMTLLFRFGSDVVNVCVHIFEPLYIMCVFALHNTF